MSRQNSRLDASDCVGGGGCGVGCRRNRHRPDRAGPVDQYARRRDEARLNEIANQRVDEARKNGTLWMGAGKEPDWNPPVRKTSKDPLVQGVDWEIVPPHLNRLSLETPLEPTVSPPTDLETRFAATFGPVGRAKARVDVSPDARTATDFETEYLAYRLRDVNTYLAGTRDTGEAKVAGERFLRAAIEQFSHVDRTGGDSRDEARALGVAALALGSDDALVRSYYADIVNDGTTWSAPTVFRIVESTIRSLEPGRYPAFVEVRLRTTLQHVVDEGAIPDEMARTAAFHAATARWLREASVNPEDGRYVWRRLNNVMNVPQSHWEDLFRRVLHEKTVNPWLLRMIAARHYDKLAWRARGHGMAGSVTGEGWKNFEIGLNRAADLYREAWLMHPERPESAMAMILIATANGGKFGTPADWFEKAIAAECDRFGVYWDYGSSLLPRWGGSHEELFEFHRACLDTGRFDTFVPTIFLGLLEHLELHEQVGRERMFEQLPGLEAACVEFARALTNAPPGPHAERLRRDRIGRDGHAILLDVLARAGHADEARTLALEYPADGSPARMDERGGAGLFDFSRVRATTNANKADVEDLVDKLVKAPLSTMPDESAVRAKIAGLRAAKDPHAEPFLSALDELLKQRQAWSQGEWVEIDPTTDTKTLEYEGHVGRVRYEDGLRELIGDKRRIAQIGTGFLLPFSIPFEVEAILDSKPEKIGSNAGGLEGAGFQWMPAVDVALPWTIDEAFRNTERAHPFVGYSKHGFAGYRLPPDLSGEPTNTPPWKQAPFAPGGEFGPRSTSSRGTSVRGQGISRPRWILAGDSGWVNRLPSRACTLGQSRRATSTWAEFGFANSGSRLPRSCHPL